MKLLVLGIYQDDFRYPFTDIFYKIDKSDNLNSIIVTHSAINKKIPKIKSGKIVNRIPSSTYVINNKFFIEKEFNEIDDVRLYPELIGKPTNDCLTIEQQDKKVDGSFSKSESNGDKNTQQETIGDGSKEKKDEKPPFNIDDFDILFEKLINHKDITKAYLSHNIRLKSKSNENGKVPVKYFICEDILRTYKQGGFLLANKQIKLIEIEAGGSWRNTSTWFFISDNVLDFSEKDINNIVFDYIGKDNILKDIEVNLLKSRKIKFVRKNHPESLNEKDVSNWSKRAHKLLATNIG